MATMKTLNGYGFNATELNGKTASDYLLKTDTAADTSKLGGKAPEYYIQPRNLLDNSDFTNPVNQRGQTSYNSVGYTIDRWTKESNAILTIADDCINIDNSANSADEVLLQKVDSDTAAKMIGKIVTVVICTSDGTVYANSGVVAYDVPVGLIAPNGFTLQLYFYHTAESYQVARFILRAGMSISVKWIALYEGSYTADTLPPYVPKGYAAELAECQRYFRKGTQSVTIGTQYNSGSIFSLSVPRMRIKPTVTLTEISSQGWGNVAASNYTLEWNGDLGSSFYANYISSVSDDVGKTVVVSYEMSADL